ncbi:putative B3 domain-containing protein At5g58280 [Pyrus communis]|uniref:putative B3 domain-containing protein At5g58280 n=1 Tax=Pyrus communis TaxID=23211 RepID=UPI0035C1949C
MVAIAATTYEEARNQRLEENKRKFQDLGISSISKTLTHLTASPNKTQPRVSKPKARNACLDIEPRRSSRQRNTVQTYCDEVDIDLSSLRKRSRSRSSSSFCGSYLARPMEEVRLCSYEERQAALKAAEKLLENLQTDNPSFVKTMVRSHVYSCFWLGLPTRFCDEYLSKTGSDMVLEDEHGKEYDAVYIGSRTGLSGGWRAFALEHKLDDGDALVFELTEPTRFKIYIVKVSSMSSIKSIVDKEDSPSAENTLKTAVKPNSESTQKRRTKRGSVSDIDDSQPSPGSESDQRRRSKRGIVPPTDDAKVPTDLESNQIRRSKRGAAPVADDSKTNFNSESNQLRRSRRGTVPAMDDTKASPDLGSHQKRRSKRGTVPAMDDTKASPDLGSDQKRRSKRGVVPEMDGLETSPKLSTESPKGCETKQEVSAMKVDEVAPKQVRKKAKANRVRLTESPEGCEFKPEKTEEKPEVPENKPEVEEKNARAEDENECVAKKPRKKVVKQRLFRKRA